VTLYGWEQSSDEGHVNFIFIDPDHPINPDRFDFPRRPAEYIEDLPTSYQDFLAIPHHTNAVSYAVRDDGTHNWRNYPWGEPCPRYLRLVEIFQSRGNFEREDPPEGWRAEFRNHGSSVQSALTKGHPLGFVGGTDNHAGWPARIQPSQRRGFSGVAGSWIFTGAWVTQRTREAILDALTARHTWACWDTRAVVRFSIDGALQGDRIDLDEPRALRATIRMAVEAPLASLELVTEGETAIEIDVSDLDLDIDTKVDLDIVDAPTFFYLRARQVDGALIYASPIFVGLT
jgi:hypothetical protein